MDPALDPPPFSVHSTGGFFPADAPPPAPAAANPAPAHSVLLNHPPYAEMITAAITALNERDGSSKRAIDKYIETHYHGLPPTHSTLLANNLKRMKDGGQLIMVKKSYALPSRSTAAAVNGDVNAAPAEASSSGVKKRPGRPPKPKADAGQAAVPVFAAAPINVNAPPAQNAAAVPAGTPARGRGRPPKRAAGVPQQSGGVGKRRGRPAKSAVVAPAPAAKGSGRPRGRPPRAASVAAGAPPPAAAAAAGAPAVPVPVGGKRRGRPPKAGGEAKKARNTSAVQPRKPRKVGKPVGRPRKNPAAPTNEPPQDNQLLNAYLSLNEELKALKGKVRQTVDVVRPNLENDAAITALNELEVMAQNVHAPPPPPRFQVPPQPQQPQPQN